VAPYGGEPKQQPELVGIASRRRCAKGPVRPASEVLRLPVWGPVSLVGQPGWSWPLGSWSPGSWYLGGFPSVASWSLVAAAGCRRGLVWCASSLGIRWCRDAHGEMAVVRNSTGAARRPGPV